jgi:hypothetical protein
VETDGDGDGRQNKTSAKRARVAIRPATYRRGLETGVSVYLLQVQPVPTVPGTCTRYWYQGTLLLQ